MYRLMRAGAVIVLATGAAANGGAQQGGKLTVTDARKVSIGAPQTIVQVDTEKLKGEVAALAWSADGKEIYIQAVQRERSGAVKSAKHYLVSVEGKSVKSTDGEPAWAEKYWSWKSAQTSPASPAFKIAVEEREETKHATAAVGDMAKGGGGSADGRGAIPGTSAEEAGNIANMSQQVTTYSLKVKGNTLGEWVNELVIPGLILSWAPAPARLLAITRRDGSAITVLDEEGHKQELTGAKDAVVPSWSSDGRMLAWLEKKDRKHFDLTIAEISAQ